MSNRDTVFRVDSGLGNQLFQYAAGRSRCKKLGGDLLIDPVGFSGNRERFFALDRFKIKARRINQFDTLKYRALFALEQKLGIKPACLFRESKFYRCDEDFFQESGKTYFWGYWQALGYVTPALADLREEITLRDSVPSEYALPATFAGARVCAVHVRRGDYVNHPFFYALPDEYYKKAARQLRELRGEVAFFVFTDDPAWAREYLDLPGSRFFSTVPRERPEWDFELMRRCDDFIISNSTFSWWAAMLGAGEQKAVIRPARWFKIPEWDASELLPKEWFVLD